MHRCLYGNVYMYGHIHAYMDICVCIYVYIFMCLILYINIGMYVHTCEYAYMYMCIYMSLKWSWLSTTASVFERFVPHVWTRCTQNVITQIGHSAATPNLASTMHIQTPLHVGVYSSNVHKPKFILNSSFHVWAHFL